MGADASRRAHPDASHQEIHAKLIDVNEALRLVVMAEGLSDGLSRPWWPDLRDLIGEE